MKTIKRSSTRKGDVITSTYEKNTSRKNIMGNTVMKNKSATVVTDLVARKTSASGTASKTVMKDGVVVKSKTKTLSPRKVIRRGY